MVRPASVLLLLSGFLSLAPHLMGQPRFDVASVRPNPDRSDPTMVVNPGGLIYSRVSLEDCFDAAYGVKGYQISGPDWVHRDQFDINAKAEGSHNRDEIMQMLQSLLADRFKLVFHREQKELPVYVLTVGKNGTKLRASDATEDAFRMGPAAGGIGFHNIAMADFAGRFLSSIPMIGRPVLDRTGLTGHYDFTLQLSSTGNVDPGAIKRAAVEEGFSLFSYALDQLGLRLEAQKAVIDTFIIDHIEKPAEN